MALYHGGMSPLERAMNQAGANSATAGGPSQGANTTTSQPGPNKMWESIMNGTAPISAMGDGNPVAGGIGMSLGPNFTAGAALGYDHGKKADNPWEAFMAGGVGANKDGMFSFLKPGGGIQSPNAAAWVPQDPISNFVAGGFSGIAGYLF